MQDELEDLRDCGIGACKPWFLSSLANIKVSFSYFKLNPDYIVRSSDCCLNIFQRVVKSTSSGFAGSTEVSLEF